MKEVRAKKHLGQHFLVDKSIAREIASVLRLDGIDSVLEVGPGTGVLTNFLLQRGIKDFCVIEIDHESVNYLENNFRELEIIEGDFLRYDLQKRFKERMAVIGNYPYNISNQIFFKAIDNKDTIAEMAGMVQKEVAERISAGPGTKIYGILSVLLKVYFDVEYLFTVPPTVFKPVPKVHSAVIRMTRNNSDGPDCDEKLFKRLVKATFNQRRKMIRNSLKSVADIGGAQHSFLSKRPEQLGVEEFVELTNWVEYIINN